MPLKILIVEDSSVFRDLIAATVESVGGARAITAASGFEALKLLPRHKFDLIMTDLQMPDINGLELINFVKRNPNYRETPLFVITSDTREQQRERVLAMGAVEYILKPFEPTDLAVLVRRYLQIG